MTRKDAPDAWLVSFTAAGNERSGRALVESATSIGGLKGAYVWRPDRLSEIASLRASPHLLALCTKPELGLWKPAVLLEQLAAIPAGDFLLYHDAGEGFWGDYAFRSGIAPLLEWASATNRGLLPGVWIPEEGRNARWTPKATFQTMACDSAAYWDSPQVGTTFSLWRHDDVSIGLLRQWLHACAVVYAALPGAYQTGAGEGNPPDFVVDRGAQSILTNLLIKEKIGCYGKPYESSAVLFHPNYAPIPASDIGGLTARVLRDRVASSAGEVAPAGTGEPPPGGRLALFTSIPPRLDRRSANGFQLGREYQRECVQTWLDCGFEVYSVHFAEEIERIDRIAGVNYVGMEPTEDDRPGDRKPSLRAILKLMQEVDADLSGIINSDILLLNPPGWIERVKAEVPGSVVAFSRFEIDETRICVGAAPWGIDLFFLDRRFIPKLTYCGMRIGETWWDYWLPLSCWMQGAEIKHVSDYVSLHLDHPVVSSENVQEYGLRFLRQIETAAAGGTAPPRMLAFHRYFRHRIGKEKQRLAIANEDSRIFVEKVLNPTVWAAVQDLLLRHPTSVVDKANVHHRILASTLVATARVTETARVRAARVIRPVETIPASYWRLIGVPREEIGRGASLVDYVNVVKGRWPYQADLWFSNAMRRLAGKPAKMRPPAATMSEAIDQIVRLRRHPLWRLFAGLDGVLQRLRLSDGRQRRAPSQS